MGNSRLYVFTEYLTVMQQINCSKAFRQQDVSTGFCGLNLHSFKEKL